MEITKYIDNIKWLMRSIEEKSIEVHNKALLTNAIKYCVVTKEKKMEETAAPEGQIIQTKQLRKDLDACLQGLRELAPSREVSQSITKTQEAIMWLGMNLKQLAAENPYPNSYDTSNTIVEPTADGLKM